MNFVSHLQNVLKTHGVDHFGWTQLERPLSMDFYRSWLEKGHHGTMTYLSDHADLKEDSRRWAPRASSAIVVAKPYFPHPYAQTPSSPLRVALYARGKDYHLEFRQELEKIARDLQISFPKDEFLCFTDSAPILERDLAARAGLGWVGKNTCLIHPQKGSLFFLGQILTSIPVNQENATTIADHCGTCDRCIKACPTQALIAPRILDARKCISYLTIEDRDLSVRAEQAQIGDWFFGCDICQTVCPWNEKVFGKESMRRQTDAIETTPVEVIEELRVILTSSHKSLARRFAELPLLRARPLGLKRNALVVIGNKKIRELRAEVEEASLQAQLKPVAEWTLAQLAYEK